MGAECVTDCLEVISDAALDQTAGDGAGGEVGVRSFSVARGRVHDLAGGARGLGEVDAGNPAPEAAL
jgi:hypothetical protein